jgi:hypothetical protein
LLRQFSKSFCVIHVLNNFLEENLACRWRENAYEWKKKMWMRNFGNKKRVSGKFLKVGEKKNKPKAINNSWRKKGGKKKTFRKKNLTWNWNFVESRHWKTKGK